MKYKVEYKMKVNKNIPTITQLHKNQVFIKRWERAESSSIVITDVWWKVKEFSHIKLIFNQKNENIFYREIDLEKKRDDFFASVKNFFKKRSKLKREDHFENIFPFIIQR